MQVPLFATSLEPYRERIAERLAEVTASGRYILGPELEAFEAEFADYLGVRHVIGVGNGTDALTIALRALGVTPGDEVICPSLTFYATAEAIVNAGARPVFCDVDPDTACVTAATVRPAPERRARRRSCRSTCSGTSPRCPSCASWALPVLEDAAQAAGARLGGVRAGALGDAATFSFFPSKNLPCIGDGGAITTDSDEVAERARTLRFHGSRDKQTHTEVGYNSRLDSIQAAVLRVLLPELDGWNAAPPRRRRGLRAGRASASSCAAAPDARARSTCTTSTWLAADAPTRWPRRSASAGSGARGYYRTPAHRQAPMREFAGRELPGDRRAGSDDPGPADGPGADAEQAAAVVEACGARAAA